MPDAIRKQILDAAVTALSGITGIGLVSEKLRAPHQLKPQDFPAAFPIDGNATYERASYLHATANDMECEMELIVSGYVYDGTNDLATKRANHIAAIEKALTGNASLLALVNEVVPSKLVTDKGLVDNYSVFDFTFLVQYDYNHLVP